MEWIEALEKINVEVQESFGTLSKEKLYAKPDPEKWSIAENLQHLIQVNESYFPIFSRLEKGNLHQTFIGKIAFFRNIFGNMIYASVSDGGKKKVKTFPLWEPKGLEKEEDIVEKFLQQQEVLKQWIDRLQPCLEKEAVIHSPANKLIVYNLSKALDIMVAHEKRHLDQAISTL
ncbi:DinB family protein [Cecembia sp.]|uniref:DinB family protein n=1 Tax=Cecembia sp. TaxID=1898110 RepID=UPI0025BBE08A|nr:DinB family protein [Cecembia sp.]